MNKLNLIDVVREKTGVSKKVAADCVNAIFDTITQAVVADEQVVIKGFGSFAPKERAARICTNPQTGEKMNVAATRVPKFKAGRSFKDAVKSA